jgi:cytochrome c oxidase subunit 3
VSVGTIVWLSSELMFFAGLFAMYFTIRATIPAEQWSEGVSHLNVPFAAVNTLILVASSFVCEAGVKAAERFQPVRSGSLFQVTKWGMNEWITLTFIMGSVFIALQVFEYAELVSHGLTISNNPFGSVFFLATGFHGLHVLGGLFAFLFLLGRSFSAKKFGHHEATTSIVMSYYWHFVDVVWVGLFIAIYILQ